MAELAYTKASIFQSIIDDVNTGLPKGTSLDTRGDFENQLRDLFEENNLMNAPECIGVDYFGEAWEIVQSNEFDSVELESPLDFSGCESSLNCLMMEANALISASWREQVEAYIEELAEALQEVVDGCEEFGTIDELVITGGCRFGHIPHLREFDAGDFSVCMWAPNEAGESEIYYNFRGLELRGVVYHG